VKNGERTFIFAGEVDNFRVADGPDRIAQATASRNRGGWLAAEESVGFAGLALLPIFCPRERLDRSRKRTSSAPVG
jgi:hypothetical protein